MTVALEFAEDLKHITDQMQRAFGVGDVEGYSHAKMIHDHMLDAARDHEESQPPERNKYHSIPTSMLVQTFMRKLQDGMDRR